MRLTIIAATACVMLTACEQRAEEPAADANIVANEVTVEAPAAAPAGAALASLNETSWEWTDPASKKLITQSVDAKGNYVSNAGAEHFDHGTAVMKDGKGCFTSAMNKDGETCWSDPMLAEGQSGETVSDKGQKLPIKRVAYTPLTM